MYELLPCPFCGSLNVSSNLEDPGYDGVTDEYNYWIECLECPCSMDTFGYDIHYIIEKWNTRV